jgi:predicted metal-dependent phosphoesterase TrpH
VTGRGTRSVPAGHCDLHVHSSRSDGTVPPADVVRLARDAHLDAVALTDHDTLDGAAEAADAAARIGIRFVPGVELSIPHDGTFHLVALGVDPASADLVRVAEALREGRGPRNAEIVERLRALGLDVTLEEVVREAGGDVVARPHIARVLVRRGFARDAQDAFDRWLAKGRPAYVDRPRPTLAEAVAAARRAGGATVVCHPHTLGFRDDDSFVAFLASCRDAGVDAVEVRTGRTSEADERRWESIADRAGLLPSGGSDFHGENKPELKVGSGRGRLRVPTRWLDALLDRARSRTVEG